MTKLRSFAAIRKISEKRKGGAKALEALLPEVKTPAALKRIKDDRWLSMMTRRIFQAGFSWSLIDERWPNFEAAFDGFDPHRWAHMSDDDLDRLLKDEGIVRNGQKIMSVQKNAQMLVDLATEHGSAAKAFADWPGGDFIGLVELVKKRGGRLGGTTGPYMFRSMGKDGFVLTKDVSAALVREEVVEKAPTSKKDLQATQEAFNHWHEETGLPLAHISRILALSVDS